mgnify:CR=1 FL=1|tara:strand:+ start:1550 stop:1774 length:225 start_codon:yes stop_codon:yes gene_type:complete
MARKKLKTRIEEMLIKDGPMNFEDIMTGLKRYKDCPTTTQLSSLLGMYFTQVDKVINEGVVKKYKIGVYDVRIS